ncbi:DNA polymerase III subunit delta [Sphingomonas montanisoli]|uniref:DNA-directed DNA polymerase n=1 Tax=Sphingomonas montanisoli TaxID=2606412 RepID=A0A5D9C3D5_9SPHN|nr:DNA polymerase III subunit delta [Sphingomonas montanisoli]TZG26368.1 DNA polymerase III subunit delta [Sphingomonas montanisoli]
MKANAAQIARALDGADPAYRLFLLYGPDEAGSRDLAARLPKKLGADAERIDFTGSQLKADPALLADEAASISLFGGARHIRVEPAGDEIVEAVDALLESNSAGNPVVVIAGNLRKDSKLVKLALASDSAMAFASYAPEGVKADQAAIEIARPLGVQLHPEAARRIAAATGADRALMARELEKIALYIDATPEAPRPVEPQVLDAIAAAIDESDMSAVIDAALSGQVARASEELAQIGDAEGIPLIRGLLRRLAQIQPLRAEVDSGKTVQAAMASAGRGIFWKDQDLLAGMTARWSSDAIATATLRLAAAERELKRSGTAGFALVGEEVIAIARAAAARR